MHIQKRELRKARITIKRTTTERKIQKEQLKMRQLEQVRGPYLKKDKENQDTIALIIDQGTVEMSQLEETQETTQDTQETTQETTQEIDTDKEDTLKEAQAEKEEDTMKKTETGRPAMITKGDTEKVARSPQVMGDLLQATPWPGPSPWNA